MVISAHWPSERRGSEQLVLSARRLSVLYAIDKVSDPGNRDIAIYAVRLICSRIQPSI
jgi:hypothetical protein